MTVWPMHYIALTLDGEQDDGSIQCIQCIKCIKCIKCIQSINCIKCINCIMPAGTNNLPRVGLNQIAANGHRFKLFSQSSIVSIIGVVPPIIDGLFLWASDTDTFSSTDSVLQGRGNTHMSLSRGKAQDRMARMIASDMD